MWKSTIANETTRGASALGQQKKSWTDKNMEDEKLLLAEYEHFSTSFWKNEEVGEKRVNFFITLTTAIIAGIVTLVTRNHSADFDFLPIASVALSGIFLFGLVTFFRILQRNRITDEYKEIIDYLREELRRRSSSLSEYELPFRSKGAMLFRGGLAETVAVVNSFIISVIVALWFGKGLGWLSVPCSFIVLFVLQVTVAKRARKKKKESRSQMYRAGVGAVVKGPGGKVLVLERIDVPGAWQLPQGGLEIGEEPIEAIKREIREETGIKEIDLRLLSPDPRLLAYELPREFRSKKTDRGQVQLWFLFCFEGSDEEITLGDKKEFRNWKWMSMDNLVSIVVPFRKLVYQELAEYLSRQQQDFT